MIERIITEASGDDEVFRAFVQLLEDNVKLPADGFVIGEPILVTAIEYNDNVRRGLTARCRREDGSDHVIGLGEVMFPGTFTGGQIIAAYRKWLGLDPFCVEDQAVSLPRRHHKATKDDIDLGKPVELVILSVKERTARCRLLESNRIITLRAGTVYDAVPGNIVIVKPQKQWRYGGHPYLSGEIQSARLDVQSLGLVPLGLADMGIWDPREHYWAEAKKILMALCQADLRCLDAHSHLGHLVFDYYPQNAIGHYEVGLRIGEQSLGTDFTGVLLWGFMDNRPFLRCMHGYGLCLWRLGRFEEAEQIFNRMLWLNPSDNQGARFLLNEVKAGIDWEDSENRD